MRIYVMSVLVDDQAKALNFYTEKLGFVVKNDIPLGAHRWLTVVSKEAPEGTELLLEPGEHPAVEPYKSSTTGFLQRPSKWMISRRNSKDCATLVSNSHWSRWMRAPSEWLSLMIHAAISFSSSRWSKEANR
jgi:catechol 2,3-dioxygenase-like lactoylglutathione lyase family enzyme